MTNSALSSQLLRLSTETRRGLASELRRRIERRERESRLYRLYPDDGPLARAGYGKHLEFFAAGAEHDERAFLGGNRTGKSSCIAYEAACHAIGWYPAWWQGRRFSRPVVAWASGVDAKAVRESLQPILCGPPEAVGTGMIPAAAIVRLVARGGVPDAVDFCEVRHASGGTSRVVIKAYEQGRDSYMGAHVDVALLDEEPPLPIYTEVLTRTLSTAPGERNGTVMCAFTPLGGVSETVLQFLPGGAYPATAEARRQAWGW